MWAKLWITDGTTKIDLQNGGLKLLEWLPQISKAKNGGVWLDSPLSEGRQVTFRRFGNVIENFKLAVSDGDQEAVITDTQNLRRLLEQAVSYWLDKSGTVDPVWLEARSEHETNSRYALIYYYESPEDGDPYGSAFNPLNNLVSMDGWQLVIERGHWLSSAPNVAPTCLPITNVQSGYTYGTNLLLNYSFETAGGGGADIFLNWTETAGDGAIASDAVSYYHLTKSAKLTAGATLNTHIEQDMVIAASTLYALTMFAANGTPGQPGSYVLRDLTHGVDFASGTLPVQATSGWYKFTTTFTTPVGCLLARLSLTCAALNGAVVNYDYVYIGTITAANFGITSTCLDDVYVANKSSKGQITHVFYYDASGPSYSANIAASALPYDLFPAPIAVGDISYFAIEDAALYSGPFSSVVFDLDSAVVSLVGVWEYWNGAAWATLSTVDTTGSFSNDGVCGAFFVPPSNWAKTTVAITGESVYGYMIRFRVTAVGGGSTCHQQNRLIYTANQSQVAIADTDILGDIPSLARFDIRGMADGSVIPTMEEMMVFTRSTAKGSRFNPFINLSDIIQETEISFSMTNVIFAAAIDAPTGRAASFAPAAAGTGSIYITLDNPLCNHYFGAFRAFLRVKQTGGTAGDVSVAMYITAIGNTETHTAYIQTLTNQTMLDLGAFQLPTDPISTGEQVDNIILSLALNNTNVAGASVLLYDVILVPVDESAVRAVPKGTAPPYLIVLLYGAYYRYLVLDSTYPKRLLKATVLDNSSFIRSNSAYQPITSRPVSFQPNEDQSAGLVFFSGAGSHLTSIIQAYHQDRYFSMRGNR